ncbi:MAG: hypothetical protein IJV07_04655 [Alphaproteobacteria bacterium]|nr:hypothetical protein [Alphaproteobacteria bacterium]
MRKSVLLLGACVLAYSATPFAQESMADTVMQQLSAARQQGIIQADGTFNLADADHQFSGQLLCADSVIANQIKSLETALKTPDFDNETTLQNLNELLKCVSLSGLKTTDKTSGDQIQFTGHYHYPVFSDGSIITAKAQDKNIRINFGLTGDNQDFNMNVTSDKGQTLGALAAQYDANKLSTPFEMGLLVGMARYFYPQANIEEKFQQKMLDMAPSLRGAAHLLKAELYRPTGEPVVLFNGDTNDNYTLNVFSSTNRNFGALSWNGQVFDVNLDFPKSDLHVLTSKATVPADFQTKYEQFFQTIATSKGNVPEEQILEHVGDMMSGIREELVVYGLNNSPLAQLTVQLNDHIKFSAAKEPTPADVVDHAELKILQENACPIKTVSFTKAKPNMITVCRADGCADETIESGKSAEEVIGCFGEAMVLFQRFGNEMEEEIKTFSDVYVPGISDGYNIAMNRYQVNEIINQAAMVSIIAMSKDGGMGGDANLSDLGGRQTLSDELKDLLLTDQSIRSNKEGIVTIELASAEAAELMPDLKKVLGYRVVSGCTADTNICVADFKRSSTEPEKKTVP